MILKRYEKKKICAVERSSSLRLSEGLEYNYEERESGKGFTLDTNVTRVQSSRVTLSNYTIFSFILPFFIAITCMKCYFHKYYDPEF